jgi:hypothetical protein
MIIKTDKWCCYYYLICKQYNEKKCESYDNKFNLKKCYKIMKNKDNKNETV